MQLYVWRHSKRFSSWSMIDEPHVCAESYQAAQVMVLAGSEEAAWRCLLQTAGGTWPSCGACGRRSFP